MIPVLILAGGQSLRMRGGDKLLEPVDGVPLLTLQIERAQPIGPVYVALPSVNHPRATLVAEANAHPLIVPSASEGIGGTLRGAVAQLPVCDAFMIVLPDLIALEAGDLSSVAKAAQDMRDAKVWRGATEDGKPGHPIIFSADLRPRFELLSGDHGASGIIANTTTNLVRLPGNRARRDLDTPEDWAAWRVENGR